MITVIFLEGQKDGFDSFLQHLSQLEDGFLVRDPFISSVPEIGLKVSPQNTHSSGGCR